MYAVQAADDAGRRSDARRRSDASFVDDLDSYGGPSVPLRGEGTLTLGLTPDDRTEHARTAAFREGLGLRTRDLTGSEVRRLEPYLASGVRSAALADGDLSVDNRRLLAALRTAARCTGVRFVGARTTEVLSTAGRVDGVRADDDWVRAGSVVLAAGAWSGQVAGVPACAQPAVLPVKGHVLRLAPMPGRGIGPLLNRTVRALVHGSEVYLVPRSTGEIVVGATVEHQGFDLTVSVASVRQLLRAAHEVLPAVDQLVLSEVSTGLRPGTPDNGPLVGWSQAPGLFVATGHYRNGVLLCGLTADEVVHQLDGTPPTTVWSPFAPDRFDTHEVA